MLPVKVELISANTTPTAVSASSATSPVFFFFAERFVALIETAPAVPCLWIKEHLPQWNKLAPLAV